MIPPVRRDALLFDHPLSPETSEPRAATGQRCDGNLGRRDQSGLLTRISAGEIDREAAKSKADQLAAKFSDTDKPRVNDATLGKLFECEGVAAEGTRAVEHRARVLPNFRIQCLAAHAFSCDITFELRLDRKLLAERQSAPSALDAWFTDYPLEEQRIASSRDRIKGVNPAVIRTLTSNT